MTGRARGFFLAGLLGLLAIAAWPRIETLGQRPLWFDERFTFFKCEHAGSLRGVWAVAVADGWEHPPLHYAVTYVAMRVSHRLAVVRLPSALAGILTVLALAWIGRLLFDARTGFLAGLLLALSVYHVYYSMEARPYALLLLFLACEYLAFLYYRDTGRPWLLVPLALCAAAALYTHHLALPVQGAIALSAAADLGTPARRRAVGYLALAGLLAALLYVPQALNLARYLGTEKLEQEHLLRLSPTLVWQLAARWSVGDNPGNALALLALAAGIVFVVGWRRRAAVLLPWLVMPFLPFVLVPFGKFFDSRFVIAALLPFQLFVAAGLIALGEGAARLLRRGPRAAALVTGALALVLVAGSLAGHRVFRRTTMSCSEFFLEPDVLDRDGGFCREHLVLNSLNPSDGYLLRPVLRTPIVGPP